VKSLRGSTSFTRENNMKRGHGEGQEIKKECGVLLSGLSCQ